MSRHRVTSDPSQGHGGSGLQMVGDTGQAPGPPLHCQPQEEVPQSPLVPRLRVRGSHRTSQGGPELCPGRHSGQRMRRNQGPAACAPVSPTPRRSLGPLLLHDRTGSGDSLTCPGEPQRHRQGDLRHVTARLTSPVAGGGESPPGQGRAAEEEAAERGGGGEGARTEPTPGAPAGRGRCARQNWVRPPPSYASPRSLLPTRPETGVQNAECICHEMQAAHG